MDPPSQWRAVRRFLIVGREKGNIDKRVGNRKDEIRGNGATCGFLTRPLLLLLLPSDFYGSPSVL